MKCMFAVAYSNIDTNNLNLENSNIQNIELIRSAGTESGDQLYSGLIHVRYYDSHTQNNDIQITGFCFINNVFNTNDGDLSRIVSRGTYQKNIVPYNIILNNCFYDCSNDQVAVNDGDLIKHLQTHNCHADTKTLNEINQLSLGLCAGKVSAKPLTPTPTKTSEFSESEEFSKSAQFSNTDEFSSSLGFTASNCYIKSLKFSMSSEFSLSEELKSLFIDRDPKESNENNKNRKGMIAGITVGAVAVVAIIAVIAFFIIRKKHTMIDEGDIETLDNTPSTINSANPIYDKNAEDDPFKEDF